MIEGIEYHQKHSIQHAVKKNATRRNDRLELRWSGVCKGVCAVRKGMVWLKDWIEEEKLRSVGMHGT